MEEEGGWRRTLWKKKKILEMLKRPSWKLDSKEIQSACGGETVDLREWEDGTTLGEKGGKMAASSLRLA